ncbi:hypothetical protein EV645_2373 [Kribbella rubisoli]|uniref:Uncharacterized protein n=1 Tax=Kribbella rubisoli TaxID=3075929 RepID=A0A4V6MF87_9ACTN|nr:hypothetical protein EV645_2373 [Kribbella rubisoli]
MNRRQFPALGTTAAAAPALPSVTATVVHPDGFLLAGAELSGLSARAGW